MTVFLVAHPVREDLEAIRRDPDRDFYCKLAVIPCHPGACSLFDRTYSIATMTTTRSLFSLTLFVMAAQIAYENKAPKLARTRICVYQLAKKVKPSSSNCWEVDRDSLLPDTKHGYSSTSTSRQQKWIRDFSGHVHPTDH